MSDTEFTLWPLLVNNNEFVWYCVVGYVAVFAPLLILSLLIKSKQNLVHLIKNPNPDGLTTQKYLLAFKTSSIPGYGLPESVKVQACLGGSEGASPFVQLTRPLYPFRTFSRGQHDVFLLHFGRGVGDLSEVVLRLINPRKVDGKWYLREVTILEYPFSKNRWTFPVQKRIVFDDHMTEFVVNSSLPRSWKTWIFIVMEKFLTCHSFISIYGISQYVGGMNTAVHVSLLASTVSLLYTTNLQVYILSHIFSSTDLSLWTILVNCLIAHTVVWMISCVCEALARNIKLKSSFPKGDERLGENKCRKTCEFPRLAALQRDQSVCPICQKTFSAVHAPVPSLESIQGTSIASPENAPPRNTTINLDRELTRLRLFVDRSERGTYLKQILGEILKFDKVLRDHILWSRNSNIVSKQLTTEVKTIQSSVGTKGANSKSKRIFHDLKVVDRHPEDKVRKKPTVPKSREIPSVPGTQKGTPKFEQVVLDITLVDKRLTGGRNATRIPKDGNLVSQNDLTSEEETIQSSLGTEGVAPTFQRIFHDFKLFDSRHRTDKGSCKSPKSLENQERLLGKEVPLKKNDAGTSEDKGLQSQNDLTSDIMTIKAVLGRLNTSILHDVKVFDRSLIDYSALERSRAPGNKGRSVGSDDAGLGSQTDLTSEVETIQDILGTPKLKQFLHDIKVFDRSLAPTGPWRSPRVPKQLDDSYEKRLTRRGTIYNRLCNSQDNMQLQEAPAAVEELSAQTSSETITETACTCSELQQKLIHQAITSAREEFGADMSDPVYVFQRHLVFRTAMTFLHKWKLKCSEQALLEEVLSDVSNHVLKQGYNCVRQPVRYLAAALLCESLKPRFGLWQIYTEGYPETLTDVHRMERQLADSLLQTFKFQIKQGLSWFIHNLKADLDFSRGLQCQKDYLLAVFLSYFDNLSEQLKDTPKRFLADISLGRSIRCGARDRLYGTMEEAVRIFTGNRKKTGISQEKRVEDQPSDSPIMKPDSTLRDTADLESLSGATSSNIPSAGETASVAETITNAGKTTSTEETVRHKPDIPPVSLKDVSCRLEEDDHSNKDNIREMRTDLNMLKGYLHYLRLAERRQHRGDITEYCLSNRAKFDHFLVSNMQKAVDSHFMYSSKESPVSEPVLQGLWYEVCGADQLTLPWATYPFLMVFLYLTIIASLVYTALKGQDLKSDQATEWLACVLVSVLEDFFLFQPFKILLWGIFVRTKPP